MQSPAEFDRYLGCLYGLAAGAMVFTAVTGRRPDHMGESDRSLSDELCAALLVTGRMHLAFKNTEVEQGQVDDEAGFSLPPALLSTVAAVTLGLLYGPAQAFAAGSFLRAAPQTASAAEIATAASLTAHLRSGMPLRNALESTLELATGHAAAVAREVVRAGRLYEQGVPVEEALAEFCRQDDLQAAISAAVYSSLAHRHHWEDSVALAAWHAGADPTACCLTGALLGAELGVTAIPLEVVDHLGDGPRLYELAMTMKEAAGY